MDLLYISDALGKGSGDMVRKYCLYSERWARGTCILIMCVFCNYSILCYNHYICAYDILKNNSSYH